MQKIILASASPRRKELLTQIGVVFEIEAAKGEEKISSKLPAEVVKELSMQKAKEVSQMVEADILIGADTVVAVDDKILGKPKDEENALSMIRLLQGRTHEVITGVTVLLPKLEREICFAEVTKVSVFPMTEEQMFDYIQTKESMDKAGAYAIQGKFAAYISSIEGDYNNVVGLPVGRLYQEVLAAGVDMLKGEEE